MWLYLIAAVSLANPGEFCSEIFDRGFTDRDIHFIDILREAASEDLAQYLEGISSLHSLSKPEIKALAERLQDPEIIDQPTDAILLDITNNLNHTKALLRDDVKKQHESNTDDKVVWLMREHSPRAEARSRADENQQALPPAKENFVNIGNIGEARKAHGLYYYMVAKPWDLALSEKLRQKLEERKIAIISQNLTGDFLLAVHPKELGVLSRLEEVLMSVEPFKGDPTNFSKAVKSP